MKVLSPKGNRATELTLAVAHTTFAKLKNNLTDDLMVRKNIIVLYSSTLCVFKLPPAQAFPVS